MIVRRIGLAIERESVFARRVLTGIGNEREQWKQKGFDCDLHFLFDTFARDARELEHFDGFIAQIQNKSMAQRLARTGKPVVDVLNKNTYENCAVVNPDNEAIAKIIAEHLLSRRFTQFAFCGREGVRYSDEREQAFQRQMTAAGYETILYRLPAKRAKTCFSGIDPRRELLVENPLDGIPLRHWVKSLPRHTAIFCCQDLRAYQLLRICRELERSVPDDLAIVGVDDDPIFCNFTAPRLSSVNPDAERVGAEALALVVQAVADKRLLTAADSRTIAPCALSGRESTDIFRYNPPWLGEALAFIDRHVAEYLTANDVFRAVGKSHTLVDRLFREILNTTVQKTIMNARLERARFLLRTTTEPIKTIAQKSGFASVSYFCTVFAKAAGISAGAYRHQISCK